jgi:hypothetical protein
VTGDKRRSHANAAAEFRALRAGTVAMNERAAQLFAASRLESAKAYGWCRCAEPTRLNPASTFCSTCDRVILPIGDGGADDTAAIQATIPSPPPTLPPEPVEDARERSDRAAAIVRILERCRDELERLEQIPTDDADDINAISAAKGYVARALGILGGRFQ